MKVLFAGLGGVGQRHLRNLKELEPAAEVSAYRVRGLGRVITDTLGVADGDIEAKYGVRRFDALDAALAAKPDAVVVSNPSRFHVPVARAAVEAGVAVFLEKPVSDSPDGLDELVELAERKHVPCLVAYQLRFHPSVRKVAELLAAGAIGRVLSVNVDLGEYLPAWHPYEDYREMYAARKDLGGGVLVTQIHEFDYLYWWFGLPRTVYAVGGQLSRLEVDVEDVADVLLGVPRDGRVIPVHVHLDYVQRPPVRRCVVVGDAGKIVLDLRAPAVALFGPEGQPAGEWAEPDFQRNRLFLDEMAHFLACVRGTAAPVVSLRDGVRSLRVALAARESLETGRVVALDPAGEAR